MKQFLGKDIIKESSKLIYSDFNQKLSQKVDLTDFNSYKDIHDEKMSEYFGDIKDLYEYANRASYMPKYGVSGVGGANTKLTRLWDAAGLEAAAGTDTLEPMNDFDNLPPFNRKKCVGVWSEPDETGKAHFTVNAYYGDPDYVEDGSMGDYVAVEVKPFWYYQNLEEGILGVSAGYQEGWSIHPVCIDEKGNIRLKTYLPCYNLAVNESEQAVSLPGYHPSWGNYKKLRDIARTYSGGNIATHLEPMAVRHYEWLLFTIEYATTNAQSVMYGASSMPYSANDKVSVDGENVNYVIVTAAIGNKYVVGQTIYLGTDYSITPSNTSAYNIVTAIETCDADGSVSESGEYRKITFDGEPQTVTAGTTTISSRPWITGSCGSVKTPSGSPINNTDGKHSMRYRFRENVWGNIHSTCNDLFASLEGTKTDDNDTRHIAWHFLTDQMYYPASASNPNRTDIETDAFVRLAQDTEHVSGYIKTMKADSECPYCIVPTIQTGGTNNTYYADYANIVNGAIDARSARFGGYTNYGLYNGPLLFSAERAPLTSLWFYGAGLYFRQ